MPPIKSPSNLGSENPELLSQIMTGARKHDEKVAHDYAGREQQIDELEDEIIKEYSNNQDLRLPSIPDPISIQKVFAASTAILGRITEIYNLSIKNTSKLRAIQQTLMDGLLPLISGGSADLREAKARGCMQTINYLIAVEEGLIIICDSTMKNVRISEEMASRALKAIEIDIQHFSGSETLKTIVEASRQKRHF